MCILSMLMFQKMLPLWVGGLLLVTGVQGYQLSSSLASQPFLMPGGAQYRYPINIFFLTEFLKIWNKCRFKRCNLTNVFKTASISGTSWPSRQLELLQILPKGKLSVIEKFSAIRDLMSWKRFYLRLQHSLHLTPYKSPLRPGWRKLDLNWCHKVKIRFPSQRVSGSFLPPRSLI